MQMKEQGKIAALLVFGLLALTTLACSVGGLNLPEVSVPEGAAATAGAAARGAATAAAEAGIQETVAAAAGTVVSGAADVGGAAVATLQATDFTTEIEVDAGALREKVESVQPDASGNMTVVITDDELNQAVTVNPEANGEPVIQDVAVAFTGGNIVLSGILQQPLTANLVATFSAAVTNGELAVELEQAAVGGVPLPVTMLSPVEDALNDNLQQALDRLPDNYTLSSVTVGEGTMTIVATP
jgi:hypothetical protein